MRALVTGSTGFVGANLVERLGRDGWDVIALQRSTSSLAGLTGLSYQPALGDILNPASLHAAMQGCDAVFHVAGVVADYWQQDLERLYYVNVDGTRNVLQAALATGVQRLVYTSSLAALGSASDGQLSNETHKFNLPPAAFPYGHSKYLAELEVQKAVEQGLHAVIVNPSVVIGPRDASLYNSRIILEVQRGLARIVTPGGVNVVDALDVAEGHLLALERGRPGERYFLGGHNLPIRQLVGEIANLLGSRPPLATIPVPLIEPLARLIDGANRLLPRPLPISGQILRMTARNLYADNSKAIRELGWQVTPLRQTLQRAIDWLRREGHLD